MAGETSTQVSMRDIDQSLSLERIRAYMNLQWICMIKMFTSLDKKAKLAHKDFSGFIVRCDRHYLSPDHDNHVLCLFQHPQITLKPALHTHFS